MDFETDSYTNYQQEPVKTWPARAIGAGIVILCILLILSLLTYNIDEMGWAVLNPTGYEKAAAEPCTNMLGTIGLYLAGMLYALLGGAAVYSVVLVSLLGAAMITSPLNRRLGRWVALIVMIICSCAFLSIQPWICTEWAQRLNLKSAGGLLGHFDGCCVAEPLLGARWAMVLMLLSHAIALIYFACETPLSIARSLRTDIIRLWQKYREKRSKQLERKQKQEEIWKSPHNESNRDEQQQVPQQEPPSPEPTAKPRSRFFPPSSIFNRSQSPSTSEDEASGTEPLFRRQDETARTNIQTAPPPIPVHRQEPTSPTMARKQPERKIPARDPFDQENREDEERVPNFTPVPALPKQPQHAPEVPPLRTPRPPERNPRHLSSGDNLFDLMPEVEETIERQNRGESPEVLPATPRSRMPLSPAALAALRKFQGTDIEEGEEDLPDKPLFEDVDDIDTPPVRQDITPLHTPQPAVRNTPEPAPAPAPVQTTRPGIVERLRKAPAPARELPEDTRDMYEDYPLPPYDMLNYRPPADEDTAAAREEMFSTQQNIIETLASFRIDVEAGDITRGPSITRYEFYPPKGLKLNRISNLADNLRMATQSKSINILAPIPGKNTVGIELENEIKSPVYLRELLQSEAFHNPKLRIPVALGKDVYGSPVIGDLAAMPHTLVAGTTGSGKSVCVNSMILSMLYKFRPDELRLILVDPKVVEMQPYKKLPHLACPVVTNAARVIGALRWAVNEMEHRYKLFSKIGVRNFEDFNNRPEDFEPEPDEDEVQEYNPLPDGYDAADAIVRDIEDSQGSEYLPEEEQGEFDFDADERIPAKLPYIVIIIDELADLMMQVKEDLENYIARLTQKARAAGIHLVAATQTPRANVITGIIKANIPSRLAFKVASPLDSRVILDTNGAENLLGKGDFLFLPPGGITKMTRAQGAFVSDPEIASIVKFCAAHAKQNFVQGVTAEMNNAEGGCGDGGSDGGGRLGGNGMSDEDAELYTRCVNLVITERKASTSMLQRRFSIGYGRAAKMMDMMEARGIIGPASGNTSRPREVLVEAPE